MGGGGGGFVPGYCLVTVLQQLLLSDPGKQRHGPPQPAICSSTSGPPQSVYHSKLWLWSGNSHMIPLFFFLYFLLHGPWRNSCDGSVVFERTGEQSENLEVVGES